MIGFDRPAERMLGLVKHDGTIRRLAKVNIRTLLRLRSLLGACGLIRFKASTMSYFC